MTTSPSPRQELTGFSRPYDKRGLVQTTPTAVVHCWHSTRIRPHHATGLANPNSGHCSTWNTHSLISQGIHIRRMLIEKNCRKSKFNCFVAPPTFLAFFQPEDISEEISESISARSTPNSSLFALLPDPVRRSRGPPGAPGPVPTRPIREMAEIHQPRASKHSLMALFPPPTLRNGRLAPVYS